MQLNSKQLNAIHQHMSHLIFLRFHLFDYPIKNFNFELLVLSSVFKMRELY